VTLVELNLNIFRSLLKQVQVRRPYNVYCVGGDIKPCTMYLSTATKVIF